MLPPPLYRSSSALTGYILVDWVGSGSQKICARERGVLAYGRENYPRTISGSFIHQNYRHDQ